MIETTNDRYLNKIKKLLALSGSSNPNEAAQALAMAQKLMRAHNISMQDIRLSVISEVKNDIPSFLNDRSLFNALFDIICSVFGVDGFIEAVDYKYKRVIFIGISSRVEIADYFYTILVRQVLTVKKEFVRAERLAMKKDMVKRVRERIIRRKTKAYLQGWLNSIHKKVRALAIDGEEVQLLELYMKKYELQPTRERRAYFDNDQAKAYYNGIADGANFNLYHGVSGFENEKLGFQG